MAVLRVVLHDQLSLSLASLQECDKDQDVVLLLELEQCFTRVQHHQKKLVLWISAIRHFARNLEEQGYRVVHVPVDDAHNTGCLRDEVARHVSTFKVNTVSFTHPSEFEVMQDVLALQRSLPIPVTVLEDTRFLCSLEAFAAWSEGKKQLRMEMFYRSMRRKYNLLMQGESPEGGQWNYDSDNRKVPKVGLTVPKRSVFTPCALTQNVMQLVAERYSQHFGSSMTFDLATTRSEALEVLQRFVAERLERFGDYQDAMVEGEPWMFHAHISFYLNCGLLLPIECIEQARDAYEKRQAPLNAVEGFIRQILGWREYVRGIYWLKMPEYKEANFFQAERALPEFYWTGRTKMNCIKQCVQETKDNAYAHHIQRLMVLGNFALLAGLDPKEVNRWYWIVYMDAYEWVELPNVSGMILFADGGYLASKPYAAGGAYINKMSNYCKQCVYRVQEKTGVKACPFNYLYWDFLVRNREKCANNPRIGMMYKTYDRMDEAKKEAISASAKQFFERECE